VTRVVCVGAFGRLGARWTPVARRLSTTVLIYSSLCCWVAYKFLTERNTTSYAGMTSCGLPCNSGNVFGERAAK
jgi:hypothetical protein